MPSSGFPRCVRGGELRLRVSDNSIAPTVPLAAFPPPPKTRAKKRRWRRNPWCDPAVDVPCEGRRLAKRRRPQQGQKTVILELSDLTPLPLTRFASRGGHVTNRCHF